MLENFKNNFDTEPINKGRQVELDVAKGFAIICMVWVHALEGIGPELSWTGIMPIIVEHYLGGMPAAPVFMFCMGIGMVYSRDQSSFGMIKRGVQILLTGIALNFARSGLGAFIVWLSGSSVSEYLNNGQVFFVVDILEFAGLAFICIGIMRKLNLNSKIMLCIAALCSIIGGFVRFVSIANPVVSQIAGYFIGTNEDETCFPLINWLIFPVAGYIFGTYYIRCKDKKRLFKSDIPAFLLGIIYLTILALGLYDPGSDYYYMGIGEAVIVLLFVYGALGVYYRITPHLPKSALRVLQTMSSSVNTIYCIHWVLLMGTVAVLDYMLSEDFSPNMTIVTVFALIILIVSYQLAKLYKMLKKRFRP